MKKKVLLSDLLAQVRRFVSWQGYCKGNKYQYIAGINGMRRYYAQEKQSLYSRELSWEFVLYRRKKFEAGEVSYNTFLYPWKVAEMVEEYYKTGNITHRHSPHWKLERLGSVYDKILHEYENEKLDSGHSKHTLAGNRSDIRQFLFFVESKEYTKLSQLKKRDISEYIPILSSRKPAGISGSLTRLRSFVRYLVEHELVNSELIHSLSVTTSQRKKVRLGFTTEEIDRLLQATDRKTDYGKRDYAIMLLAKHTGLRSIDVVSLKLQDIDWIDNEFHVVQHKTKRPLILPLENNVGNAIADYILNSRPECDSPFVFLRMRAPYLAMSSANGSSIVRRYAKLAEVYWQPGEYKGFHSFRRHIGTSMLNADVPLSTISEILGHSTSDSTKPYLTVSLEKLKMCALSLEGLECTKGELR